MQAMTQARLFGDYRVRLDMSPEPANWGAAVQLSFTVSRNDVLVTDLEPYLGAGGHCVAISVDAGAYLHSHPLHTTGPNYGPTVAFHTLFPKPGLYKIWGQSQHRGQPPISDFVVRVP